MEFALSANVYSDNDVYFFQEGLLDTRAPVSVATLSVTDANFVNAIRETLRVSLSTFKEINSEICFWLVLFTPVAQSDSRILRYRKFKGWLKSNSILLDGLSLIEITRTYPDGVKFFGAAKIEEGDLDVVSGALAGRCPSYVIVAEKKIDENELLKYEWTGSLKEDFNLIDKSVKNGLSVVARLGHFDDASRGIYIFMHELLAYRFSKLINHLPRKHY